MENADFSTLCDLILAAQPSRGNIKRQFIEGSPMLTDLEKVHSNGTQSFIHNTQPEDRFINFFADLL